MENKESIPQKKQAVEVFYKVPEKVFDAAIRQILSSSGRIIDGINLINGLKQSVKITEPIQPEPPNKDALINGKIDFAD